VASSLIAWASAGIDELAEGIEIVISWEKQWRTGSSPESVLAADGSP
jgi:hypothetical protein